VALSGWGSYIGQAYLHCRLGYASQVIMKVSLIFVGMPRCLLRSTRHTIF